MDKNQKRKGFMRRLYRAARSAGKAKPTQTNSPVASTSLISGGGDSIAVSSEMRSASYPNRSAPAPASEQKQTSSAHGGFRNRNGEMRGGYGSGGDENVDVKAATYILWVRERLKMERSIMDQKVC